MGADVRPLETGTVVDPDAHASGGAEHLDQARVRLEVLIGAGAGREAGAESRNELETKYS